MASLKSFAVSLFGPETFRRRSSSLTPNSRLDKQDNRKRLRSRSVSSKPHEATLPSRRPSHSSIHLQNENPLSKHIDTKLGLDHARWSLRVECDDDDSEVRSRPRTSTDETIVSDTSTLAADGATSINLSTYSSSYRRKGGQMIYVYADTLRTLISSTSVRTMSPKVPQYQRTIRDIPFDILLRAFAYLDSKTVLKCERACRDWKRNLVTSVADFTLWQRVVPKTVDACLSVPSSLLLGETFRDMLMLFHRWERLGSLYGFNGSGVGVEVKPVRIVDNLPPAPQVEDSRHIVAALGNGVTLNGTTAFYLSAYPVSLASINLLENLSLALPSLDCSQPNTFHRPQRSEKSAPQLHVSLPKQHSSIIHASRSNLVALNTWKPYCSVEGEQYRFFSVETASSASICGSGTRETLLEEEDGIHISSKFGESYAALCGNTCIIGFDANTSSEVESPLPILDGKALLSKREKPAVPPSAPPLFMAYSVIPGKKAKKLWALQRFSTSPSRALFPTCNDVFLAYAEGSNPNSTPQNRHRETLLHMKDAHKATIIRIRCISDGREFGFVDLSSRQLWIRALHLTRHFLIVVSVRSCLNQVPQRTGHGRSQPWMPSRPDLNNGKRRGTIAPRSIVISVYRLKDLRCMSETTIHEVMLPPEGSRVGIASTEDEGSLFVWTDPPVNSVDLENTALVSPDGQHIDLSSALPSLISVDLRPAVSGGCKFRIYKRKHDRLNLGNSGFACLKGYPGGMWVVFHDLGEEKCVWMRRPC